MLEKIKKYLEAKQKQLKQKDDLRKAQAYYKLVKAGNVFIKFIQEDLKRQENDMNRHQRRRFESELNGKGVLSAELVDYYQNKIEWILMNINQRLNPPKQPKVQPQKNNGIQVQTEKPKELK